VAFLPKISPTERFSLRVGAKPLKGEEPAQIVERSIAIGTQMTTSKALRNFRIVLWVLVAVAAIGATALYMFRPPQRPLGVTGQEFALASTQGGTFTQADLVGKPSLVFFGYTFCPDVCPTTLAETTAWREQLGLSADDLRIIFVTVDPERDTAEMVKDYVEGFDPSVIGLVGDIEQTEKAKAAFGVFSEKSGDVESEFYLVDHTALTFLIDADGSFEGTIAYEEASDTALGKIERLVKG
jgi:protein SCO1